MLPKRLQSEMIKQWVNGLYTSGICYPRGYKVKWWHSELMVCIPQVYATQEVTKWNGDTVNLWFVYLRYMLPKRLQSEMVTQWIYGLYTSGICYPRGYKVKWLNSEFMVCIPQVYATLEVTKWNGDTVNLWFVYLRYMLPKRLQSEMIKQWVYGLYTSGICYPRGYKVKWRQWVYGLYTPGIWYRRGYKVKWWHSEGLYTLVTLYIGFVN